MKRLFKKRLIGISLILMLLAAAGPAFALLHGFKGLTGSAAVGDPHLDGIPTANISDGEIAVGMDANGFFRTYQYDADNTVAEDGDKYVYPAWTNTIGGTAYTGTGAWVFRGIASASDMAGVSSYASAATSVTPDFNKARTHLIYLAGAAATTGVSVVMTAPTLPTGSFSSTYNLVFQQPSGNTCYAIFSPTAQTESGVSPTQGSAAGATAFVKATYNSVTGKWSVYGVAANLQ